MLRKYGFKLTALLTVALLHMPLGAQGSLDEAFERGQAVMERYKTEGLHLFLNKDDVLQLLDVDPAELKAKRPEIYQSIRFSDVSHVGQLAEQSSVVIRFATWGGLQGFLAEGIRYRFTVVGDSDAESVEISLFGPRGKKLASARSNAQGVAEIDTGVIAKPVPVTYIVLKMGPCRSPKTSAHYAYISGWRAK